jgi:hypothetical protein
MEPLPQALAIRSRLKRKTGIYAPYAVIPIMGLTSLSPRIKH